MVEIGSVIEAVVTRIEQYGIYLDYDGQTVLVLVPEVSWKPVRDLREFTRVGDRLKVHILRYNYADRAIVGSIRQLHPEESPYRQLSRLPPGTPLRAQVQHRTADGITVQLENGAWGHVEKRLVSSEIKPGDLLELVIASLEVDDGRLWLEPARKESPGSNGAGVTPLPVATV